MASPRGGNVRYSIVVPIYNEEAVLPILLKRLDALMDALDGPAEAILVDDGSTDSGSIFLRARAKDNRRYRYIGLTRNFGHQIAITAGMDAASGQAVIVMDGDLQDPPEIVQEMIACWKEGYDVVYARRRSREGEGTFKRWTAAAFYRLLNRMSSVDIPEDVGDFRLIDRRVLDAFRQMPEQDRFVRGMFAWLGFRQTAVEFDRPARVAGETKYPFWKMVRLAVNGVIGFSDAPLKAAIWLGLAVSVFALCVGAYAVERFLVNEVVAGWTSIVVVVSFLSGINLLVSGVMGLYIGRIHAEVKRRPLYIVDQRIGFEPIAARESDASRVSSRRRVRGRASA
jgi:glycosyltransferase involved in cell wall biosynthesis